MFLVINTFITEYNLLNNSKQINNTKMIKTGNQTTPFAIGRVSIQDPNNKYIEEVKWGKGNQIAIAIGLNPSSILPSLLDKTNELVSFVLNKNGYDGYYLMNLFSFVQTNHFRRLGHIDQTDVIRNTINSFLTKNPFAHIDVIFFCGRGCYFTENMISNLKSITSKNVHYRLIGTNKYRHKHPGRGVSPKNINLSVPLSAIPFFGHYIR